MCRYSVHTFYEESLKTLKTTMLPLTITFIDFKKAFDSINGSVMSAVLRHFGIPSVFCIPFSRVQLSYSRWFNFRIIPGHHWRTAGGCPCPVFLFMMLIDYLMKEETENTKSGVVTHLRRSRGRSSRILKRSGCDSGI